MKITRLPKFVARLFSASFFILAGTLTVAAADDQNAAVTMQGSGAGTPTAPGTVMVSLLPNGSQFEQHTAWSAMSDDGRYVAFTGGDAFAKGAYRHDLKTGETEVVSVDREGNTVPVMPGLIAMSADGRYVFYAFLSIDSPPPIPDGPGGYYMRDMDTGETELIEMPTTDGEPPDAWPHNGKFDVSADGRTIAFVSLAENLVPGRCLKCAYVLDRDANIVERVSVAFDGGPLTGPDTPWEVVISADGRYVAFISAATNHVPDDTNEYHDVFVYDRVTEVTERVSVGFDGSEGNHYSGVFSPPVISADGRYVAFSSQATNLVPEDANGRYSDVFVHDRHAGTIELISVSSDGTQGNRPAYPSGISADGRFIVFSSNATNLVPDDTNGVWDSFIHDRDARITERVSVASDGTQGDGGDSIDSRVGGVSANGRFIAFGSRARNLVPDDTNDKVDVFVRDRGASPGDAELMFDPPSLDFGEVGMGASSSPRSATLSNIGDADANGLAFGLTGGSGFEADTSACGATLPVDGSCEISVIFTPAAPGPASATLHVESNEGPVANLHLSGNGDDGAPPPDSIFEDRFE